MTPQGQGVLDAVGRLRAALEETAGALASADLDQLLRSGPALELATRTMPQAAGLPAAERAALLEELARTRVVLQRCHRFGDVLLDVVRLTFEAQGRTPGYGPREVPAVAYAKRSFDARG